MAMGADTAPIGALSESGCIVLNSLQRKEVTHLKIAWSISTKHKLHRTREL